MAFNQVEGHSYCAFPEEQRGDLEVFLERILLGGKTGEGKEGGRMRCLMRGGGWIGACR